MNVVAFHPEAQMELVEAAEFYDARSPGLGARFLDEVNQGLGKIAEAPERWPRSSDLIRRHLLSAFPYGLLYMHEDGQIVVVAVMHLHRRPDYWLGRIR